MGRVSRGSLFVAPRGDRASLRSQAVVAYASCLRSACRAGDLRGRHGGLAAHQGGCQRVGAHRRSPTCRPDWSQHSVTSAAELVGNFGPFERSLRANPLLAGRGANRMRELRARAGPKVTTDPGEDEEVQREDPTPTGAAVPQIWVKPLYGKSIKIRLDPATTVDARRSGFRSRSRPAWRLIEQFRPTGAAGKTRGNRVMTVVHPRPRNRGCPYALACVRCCIWRAVGLPIPLTCFGL